jgi:hypothetical protein
MVTERITPGDQCFFSGEMGQIFALVWGGATSVELFSLAD